MFYNSQQPYPQQLSYQPNYEQQPHQPYYYNPRAPQSAPTMPTEPTQQPYYPSNYEQQPYQPYYYDPRVPQSDPTMPTEPTQQQIQQYALQYHHLKQPVLTLVKPWVDYGVKEAKYTSVPHAMTEVAAITYLIGRGMNPTVAHHIVESWEKNEQF
ncbi:hypothetical protein AB1283_06745 [Bacillus sp. S13(2024)]|uniref:hypothetical protein n=1 Tax=unclassified Bacillus (in: firmicutes) TaxID=185979 RepID=UPI003D2602D1